MTKLPNIHAMDPDDWYDAVNELAEQFENDITAVLDEHTDLEETRSALYTLLEPYMIDPDDGTIADQLLVWVDDDADEKTLCIGVPHGDYAPVAYRKDDGFWWYTTDEPDDDDQSPSECHREIAEFAVSTTAWGDPDLAYRRVEWAKRERKLATPYLEQLEEALTAGDPSAEDLRELFVDFLKSCGPDDPAVDIHDISSVEHRTHLELRDDEEVVGRILALTPGKSLERADILDAFDLEDSSDIFIATDHIRFTGLLAGGGIDTPWPMRMPSKKDDDPTAFHGAMSLVVPALRSAMSSNR